MTFYFAKNEFKDPVVDEICYLPSTLMVLEHFILIFSHVEQTMIQFFDLIYPYFTFFNLIVMMKSVIYLAH